MTPEQAVIWRRAGMDDPITPSGAQTSEQAVNLAVASFQFACALEGVEPPAERVIRLRLLTI